MTCRIAIFCFWFLARPLAHLEIERGAAPTDRGVSHAASEAYRLLIERYAERSVPPPASDERAHR